MNTSMKLFLLFPLLIACAKPDTQSGVKETTAVIAPAPPKVDETPRCNIINTCTYSGTGFSREPMYNCLSATYEFSEHPEIPEEYFAGRECVTAFEDYQTAQGICGPPGMYFPCQKEVQGPGEKALQF